MKHQWKNWEYKFLFKRFKQFFCQQILSCETLRIVDEVFEGFEGLFLSRNVSILLFLLNMYFHRDKTECSGPLKAIYILKVLIRWCTEGVSLLSINMPLFLFLFSNKIVSYGIFKLCFPLSQRFFLNIFYPWERTTLRSRSAENDAARKRNTPVYFGLEVSLLRKK